MVSIENYFSLELLRSFPLVRISSLTIDIKMIINLNIFEIFPYLHFQNLGKCKPLLRYYLGLEIKLLTTSISPAVPTTSVPREKCLQRDYEFPRLFQLREKFARSHRLFAGPVDLPDLPLPLSLSSQIGE